MSDPRPPSSPDGSAPPPGMGSEPGDDPARAALARVRSGAAGRRGLRLGNQPPRLSSARPDDRDPQRLSDGVTEWVRSTGAEQELAVAALTDRWPAIVGEQIAAHASVGEYRDGRLTVVADSPEWALQLRYLMGKIQQRIIAEVGPDLVRDLDVRGPGARRTPGAWRVRTGRRSPRT